MMKISTILIPTGSLLLLGALILFKQSFSFLTPKVTMPHPSPTACNLEPIQVSFRIWLDPIYHSPDGGGALPPGVDVPSLQPQGPETHALNLDLTLINDSQSQQSARVVEWNWTQGSQTGQGDWDVPPDLSPLNRYNHVQRQLVQLHGERPVAATMKLEINGQPCEFRAWIRP